MRGQPYYEYEDYQAWLLSRERREAFPPERLMEQINWEHVENFLDFGMGPGYFTPYILDRLGNKAWLWGVECQEDVIDQVLKRKTLQNWERLTVFYSERTEHPLLPDWIPDPEVAFCSCVISTFADPTLAISGIGRKLKNNGLLYILDFEKVDTPWPPDKRYKMSENRMRYCIEEAGFEIHRKLNTNSLIYFLELRKGPKAMDEKNRFAHLNY